MIIFLTIAVIVLAAIDIYFYKCLFAVYETLKIMNDNDKVLKDKIIEVMSWERK